MEERKEVGKKVSSVEEAQENLLDAQKQIWQQDNDAKLAADQIEFRSQNLRKELASGVWLITRLRA